MMPDVSSLLWLFCGVGAGALVSSFAGFAFAPVAGLLLMQAFPPAVVIPLMMICRVVVQSVSIIRLKSTLRFRGVGLMVTPHGWLA
jgi:hypothetical protein